MWVHSQKQQNDLSLLPRWVIQHHSNPSLWPKNWCQRSWMILWRPRRCSRLTPQKDVLFIIGDWNAKVGSQEIPGVRGKSGSGVQNEARQRLTEFCQGNTLVIANTLFPQHKKWLYTWTSPDGLCWHQIDYILCSRRRRSPVLSAKTRLGADCGSGHELWIAKYRFKQKKWPRENH